MYQRLSAVLFPVLAVALIGTGYWGYQEHQEKNSILIKAENQYQRSFHNLSYYLDQLNSELGKAMAVPGSSEQFQKRKLIQVWRMTSQAQNEINQLPLTLLPFNKTEDFLDHISNFTYRAALRDLTKQPLSIKEQATLRELYKRSKELSGELRGIQAKVINNNLRWMDVEAALATENNQKDNMIIDGFKSVDGKVGEYSEVDWGTSVQGLYEKRSSDMLDGNLMTTNDIHQKAMQLFGDRAGGNIRIAENGQGTEFSSFSAVAELPDGRTLEADFTKKGGHLLWFMNPREVEHSAVDPGQAKDTAEQFLREFGYGQVTPINYDEYGHISSITFAATEGGIVYYPCKVAVKVAMDNAEVLGLQATDFVYEKMPDKMAEPAMTMDEASKLLGDDFKRSLGRKAYIRNDLEDKVLCYEFVGKVNGGEYRIFINANTGEEEKVESLQPIEARMEKAR